MQNILSEYAIDEIVIKTKIQDGKERFALENEYNLPKHARLWQYKKALEPELYSKLFKFAVVRNPWDMMISFYFSPHRGVNKWNRKDFIKLVSKRPTLREFITEMSFKNLMIYKFFNKLNTESDLLKDVDYILKFESLQNDFNSLCEKIDIVSAELPHRNKSNKKHYSFYYDDELIEIVRKKFYEEIEVFGYKFEKKEV